MKKYTLTISEYHDTALNTLSKTMGVSRSECIRTLIHHAILSLNTDQVSSKEECQNTASDTDTPVEPEKLYSNPPKHQPDVEDTPDERTETELLLDILDNLETT